MFRLVVMVVGFGRFSLMIWRSIFESQNILSITQCHGLNSATLLLFDVGIHDDSTCKDPFSPTKTKHTFKQENSSSSLYVYLYIYIYGHIYIYIYHV